MSDRSPTLLGALRRPAPAVALVALSIFVLLGVWYAGEPAPGRVDRGAESVLEGVTSAHEGWFAQVVAFGSPVSVVAWSVLLACAAALLRRGRHAVLAIVGPGITGLATTGLKPLIGRTVGDAAGYAYPSGHTGGATSVALVAALLLIALVPTRRAVAVAVVAAAAGVAGGLVGSGMVTLGAHYPTDIVGGFCLAVAIVLGAAMLIDRVAGRSAPHPAGPGEPAPLTRPGRSGPARPPDS